MSWKRRLVGCLILTAAGSLVYGAALAAALAALGVKLPRRGAR